MRHHSQETAPSLYVQAAKDAFRKLDPRMLVRNPVMFVVAVGCVFTTASFFSRVATGADAGFSGQISLWLWFTVLFANFAEALAEGRGKAQADTLRSARHGIPSRTGCCRTEPWKPYPPPSWSPATVWSWRRAT